jgi:FSR family fosmidomycin resistance protein-like MFS transporter
LLGFRRSRTDDSDELPGSKAEESKSLLTTLTLGHLAIHWYQQLWPITLPSIKAGLGLSDVEVGTLASVKQFTTGPLFLPAGILADFFRKRTALILGASFLFLGGAYVLVAQGSTYVWVIPGVALLGIGTALWHPTATGALSLRYAERRGTAIAIHGVGASIGDTVAPVAIGGLLAILTWQDMLRANMIPALIIAFVLWRVMGKIYHVQEAGRPELRSYMTDAKNMLQHRLVIVVIGVMILTTAARLGIMTFLPIYIQEDLEYSAFQLGFFWGLLHIMGGISQPAMGYLSDKYGRKAVLLPSLIIFGFLYLILSQADAGIQLILVIGALGIFFYALQTLTMAAVLDVAGENVQASSMGITTIFTQLLVLPSPLIAGVLAERFGTQAVFLYAGSLTLLAALLVAVVRVPRTTRKTPRISG